MPVYGKQTRWRKQAAENEAESIRQVNLALGRPDDSNEVFHRLKELKSPKDRQTIARAEATGVRELGETKKWPSEGLSLDYMDVFSPISEKIAERIKAGDTKPIVVEWGCGRANKGIGEVAAKFPEADCIGYSREYYKDWKTNDRVRLIHAATGDLRRYLKDDSVSVIYSRNGLRHLGEDPKLQGTYLRELDGLIPKLKHGGYILIDSMNGPIASELAKRRDIEINVGDGGGNNVIIRRK